MLKILVRLYLVTIVTFSAAIYLVPELVIGVFHERFMRYNMDQSRGLQSLLIEQFRQVPKEQWPAMATRLDQRFGPLQVSLTRVDDPSFSVPEHNACAAARMCCALGVGHADPGGVAAG